VLTTRRKTSWFTCVTVGKNEEDELTNTALLRMANTMKAG